MDANGSRFHALFGKSDWSRCRCAASGEALALTGLQISSARDLDAEVDEESQELTLGRLPYVSSAPAGDELKSEMRRGAAVDRFGNVYAVSEDLLSLDIIAAAGTSRFWPVAGPLDAAPVRSFSAAANAATAEPQKLASVTVTADHRLLVSTAEPPGWWLFDLFAGGPPTRVDWPAGSDFKPGDAAACADGGLWLLDADHRRCWRLDSQLRPALPAPAPALPARVARAFAPSNAAPTSPAALAPLPTLAPAPLTLPAPPAATQLLPVAVDAIGMDTLLVLEQNLTAKGSLLRVAREGQWLAALPLTRADAQGNELPVLGHDLLVLPTSSDTQLVVLVADSAGNQCWRYRLTLPERGAAGAVTLKREVDFLPMRRCHGRALLLRGGQPMYDTALGWVPLVAQARRRYRREAWIETPVFDSHAAATVWHRLIADAALGAYAQLRVASRASDDRDHLAMQAWDDEPAPLPRTSGSELPYHDPGPGLQCHELLLQSARGRFLQLRLHLQGSGGSSPRLKALRVYEPRFSYLHNYLPAVYRDDEASAQFLEGLLANVEGLFTAIEDRIAQAQLLLDWRTAPGEALDWLAGWLALATEAHWPAARKRRLLRHAMTLYRWRGTPHGLRLALALALDDPDESWFEAPPAVEPVFGVRVVEKYLTRRLPDVLFGDPSQTMPSAALLAQTPWTPAQGSASLLRRWRQAEGRAVDLTTQVLIPFQLVPPADSAARWAAFCEATLGFTPYAAALDQQAWQQHLAEGFDDIEALNQVWGTNYAAFDQVALPANQLPAGDALQRWLAHVASGAPGSVERLAWQRFLRSRYMSLTRLNAAWGTGWSDFAQIPLPGRLPAADAALADWFQFDGQVLAMQAAAHRFTVLLPMPEGQGVSPDAPAQLLERARRVLLQEKPAHTRFEVRLYWAMFRVGEARLGLDTRIDSDVRARLLQPVVLGRSWLGESYLPLPAAAAQRRLVGDALH